jgi:hypothetical protein
LRSRRRRTGRLLLGGTGAHVGQGEIDRKEFGPTWSQALESGGVLVSNRVKIEIDILAVEVAARAAA